MDPADPVFPDRAASRRETDDEEVVSVAEAAKILGVSRRRVQQLAREEEWHFVHSDFGARNYRLRDVVALAEKRATKTAISDGALASPSTVAATHLDTTGGDDTPETEPSRGTEPAPAPTPTPRPTPYVVTRARLDHEARRQQWMAEERRRLAWRRSTIAARSSELARAFAAGGWPLDLVQAAQAAAERELEALPDCELAGPVWSMWRADVAAHAAVGLIPPPMPWLGQVGPAGWVPIRPAEPGD